MSFISEYKWIILFSLLAILMFLILLIIYKKRKDRVKPIDLETINQDDTPSEIEEVLAKLENSENSRPMTTFEQEQEENAIISYQELVQAVNQKKQNMALENKEVKEDNKIEEALLEISPKEETVMEQTPEVQPKFKNSEFISPVFGKDNQSNDDFLKELKDFRNNL